MCRIKDGLFIHIQKTAGTSISGALVKNGGQFVTFAENTSVRIRRMFKSCTDKYYYEHWSPEQMRMILGSEVFDQLWKFTFVRNPWDQYVSVYNHRRVEVEGISFERFLNRRVRGMTQQRFFAQPSVYDFIGSFENLQDDWGLVADRFRLKHRTLPHLNKFKQEKNHYSYYYRGRQDLVDLVSRAEPFVIQKCRYEFVEE